MSRQSAAARASLEASRLAAVALGDEVARLVAAARTNSDQAAARSADAIRYGKLLLLVITAFSAVGATAICSATWCHGLSARWRESP